MGVSTIPAQGFLPGMVQAYAGSTTPGGWLLCDGSAVSRTTYAALFAAVATTYGVGDGSTTFNVPNLKGKVIAMQDAGQAEFAALAQAGGAKTVTLDATMIPGHTHQAAHTHGMTNTSVDHAHNVYATGGINTSTESVWHQHTLHWVSGGGNINLTPGGSGYNINPRDLGGDNQSVLHTHDYNHAHPSTNYATESPWAGNTAAHAHTTNTQSTTTTDNGTGGGAAHNNLQPYLTMNYLIKI